MASKSGGNGKRKPQNNGRYYTGNIKRSCKAVPGASSGAEKLPGGSEAASGNGSDAKNDSGKVRESEIVSLKRRMHKEIFDKCLAKRFLSEIGHEDWEALSDDDREVKGEKD